MTRISFAIISILFLTQFISMAQNSHSKIKQDNGGLTVDAFYMKVNNKERIVLVYFSADWCVPCIKLKPTIKQIEEEEKERVEVLNLDVDENPKIATYFEINTLPLFILYKNGKKVWERNMFTSKADLLKAINLYAIKTNVK